MAKGKKVGLIITASILVVAIIAISIIFAINSTYIYSPVHAEDIIKEGEMSTIIIDYNGADGHEYTETIQAKAFTYIDLPKVEKEGFKFLCWFCNYVISFDSKLYVNAKTIKAFAEFEKDYTVIQKPAALYTDTLTYTEYDVGEYSCVDLDVKDIYLEGGYYAEVYKKKDFKGDMTTVAYQGTYAGKVGSMKIIRSDIEKVEIESLNDDTKAMLLKKYAPRLWWDENENYYASSVEFALNNLKRGLSPDGYMLYLEELDKQSYKCDYFYGDKDNMKGYGFAAEKEYTYLDLSYYFFFPFNKAKTILGMDFGNHVGDWEHVVVRLKLFNENKKLYYAPVLVQYSIHSQRIYMPWTQAPKYKDTHLVGYIANGSHGIWPYAGKNVYVDAVVIKLTDICSQGEVWDLWEGNNLETYKYDAINQVGAAIGDSEWKSCFNHDYYNEDSDSVIRWGNFGFDYPITIYPMLQNAPEGPTNKKSVFDYYSIDGRFYY